MSRWKVVTVVGYADADSRELGQSIHVLDRARNHAVVMTVRSEDYPSVEAAHLAVARRVVRMEAERW